MEATRIIAILQNMVEKQGDIMNYKCKTCINYPCGDELAYPGNCRDFEEIEDNTTDLKKGTIKANTAGVGVDAVVR